MSNTNQTNGNLIQYAYMPDFELKYSEEELAELSTELSEEDEKIFKEILELEKQNNNKSDLMKDLLEAAKKGTMQYLDSMTDTTESIDRLKDPSKVRVLDKEEIIKQNYSADPNEKRASRTMGEARYELFDKNVPGTTTGMTPKGAELFEKHKLAYSQRTKSATAISSENSQLNYKKDPSVNFESLSGLRGYRVGSIVPMYSVEEIQEKYKQKKEELGVLDNTSNWLMQENYKRFEDSLMKEYGFSTRAQALDWMRENNLTIHEDPDGMYLVPTDVHDVIKHSGYRSKMTSLLEGKITREDLQLYVTEEKKEYVIHEAKVRGTRMAKGIGLSAIKDVLKCAIVVICEETYTEFKAEKKDKFVDRMLRIFRNSWTHVKAKCSDIIKNLFSNITGSIMSEILTAINDFFFGTFKSIFKIVRQMWSSIKNAFKIIFSKDKSISFGERIYEASKILSAGIVGIIGFSLNELIDKLLTSIGIPFASFISECLSGLFAGIMSAIVMMLFDKFKKEFMTKSVAVQQLQLQSKSLFINSAQVSISTTHVDMKMYETYNFLGNIFESMKETYIHIIEQKREGTQLQVELKVEITKQNSRTQRINSLKENYCNDSNF